MTITAGFTGTAFTSGWPEVVMPPMSLPHCRLLRDRGGAR